MALVWMDGFDQYGTDKTLMLDNIYHTVGPNLASTRPRTGARHMESTSNAILRKDVVVSGTTIGVGGAWFSGSGSTSEIDIIYIYTDSGAYCSLTLQSDWGLKFERNGTQVGSSSAANAITQGIYNHIEFKVVLATDATGSFEVKVNGVTVLSETNVQTALSGTVWNSVSWVTMNPSVDDGAIDDIFVWDGSGTVNNDFLGQKHVITLIPDADTATADWTGSYTDIDEIPPDDDTTYITAPDTSLPRTSDFGFSDVPSDFTNVSGIMTQARIRKDSVGSAEARVSVVSSGSEGAGALNALGDDYVYFTDMHEVDPNTSLAWTVSGVNAAQLRIKRET